MNKNIYQKKITWWDFSIFFNVSLPRLWRDRRLGWSLTKQSKDKIASLACARSQGHECSKIICLFVLLALFCFASNTYSQENIEQQNYIGEIFKNPVPVNNYNFVRSVLAVFGNSWGPTPQTEQEFMDCAWEQLVLSYEAYRRNITVSRQELEEEINRTLTSEKGAFDWKKDKILYAAKVKEKTGEPVELFENQLRHLLQIKKLRSQVMDSFSPVVTDDEAYQEFLNEYNTLGLELVQFDELKDAESFYKQVNKRPKSWDKEKTKRPNDFKRPGFVSLEFLMDMWKIPKEAVYKMMQMKVNSVHPPSPIYKGYGVLRVLEKRQADLEKYPQLKNNYIEQIKSKKKYQSLQDWIKNFKKQADIKIYKGRG